MMIDFTSESVNQNGNKSKNSTIDFPSKNSTEIKTVNNTTVIGKASKNTNKNTGNKSLTTALLITGIIFIIGIILSIKMYLDGRCLKIRPSRINTKGFRYNYSLY